jgi:hypothetical protein
VTALATAFESVNNVGSASGGPLRGPEDVTIVDYHWGQGYEKEKYGSDLSRGDPERGVSVATAST